MRGPGRNVSLDPHFHYQAGEGVFSQADATFWRGGGSCFEARGVSSSYDILELPRGNVASPFFSGCMLCGKEQLDGLRQTQRDRRLHETGQARDRRWDGVHQGLGQGVGCLMGTDFCF